MSTTERVKLTARQAKDLRAARVTAGLSQYELADVTGLTRPKIKRIEKREIQSVSTGDLDKILSALSRKPPKPRKRKSGSSNGSSRKKGRAASGRTKISVEPDRPELDEGMQAEVRRRLEESVLEVMRDMIGDSGRVLVEKHQLHDITLGRLFQAS
jgi:transcriptional regulator with XRE-family HTH domain